MRDYCLDSAGNHILVVRGFDWPTESTYLPITLRRLAGDWEGADIWLWDLLISRNMHGGTPDLVVPSYSAVIASMDLNLSFVITGAQSILLPGVGPVTYCVDLRSTDGADVKIWTPAAGTIMARDPVGE